MLTRVSSASCASDPQFPDMAWVSLWAAAVYAVNTNCFLHGWPRHFKAFVCELANDGSKDAYVSPYKYVCVHVCALVSVCVHM